jgi:hypothetical protein
MAFSIENVRGAISLLDLYKKAMLISWSFMHNNWDSNPGLSVARKIGQPPTGTLGADHYSTAATVSVAVMVMVFIMDSDATPSLGLDVSVVHLLENILL